MEDRKEARMARKASRGRRRSRVMPLGTIWRCPDELWERVALVLDESDPPAEVGRKRIDQRKALDGVIYQMRTGCQWNALPTELGDDASVHRTLQRWVTTEVFPLDNVLNDAHILTKAVLPREDGVGQDPLFVSDT